MTVNQNSKLDQNNDNKRDGMTSHQQSTSTTATIRRSPSEIAFEDDVDSGSEKCGFVCHVFVILLGIVYTVWIISFYCTDFLWLAKNYGISDEEHPPSSIAKEPLSPPTWTSVLPAVAIGAFFAAPVLYGSMNAWHAVPAPDAVSTVSDPSTLRAPRGSNVRHPVIDGATTSCSSSSSSENDIPQICDLDVADINDLVWRNTTGSL
jgi:hypothetical protein